MRGDAVLGPERIDLLLGCGLGAVVDDDVPTDRDPVVEAVEHLARLGAEPPSDAQDRDLVERGIGERRGHRTLEELDPVVEQPEPLEAVAHEVEVGAEAAHPLRRERRGRIGCLGGPEPVGDEHARGRAARTRRGSARMKIAPPPRPGAALDEVARHATVAHRVEALLEVRELRLSHRGVREERGCGAGVRPARPEAVALAQRRKAG